MSGAHAIALAGPAGDPASRVHRLDPRAKLIGLTLVTAVAVSAPPELWRIYAACAAVLCAVAFAGRVPPGALWRRARVVLPLILFAGAFVPFVRRGGAELELGPLTISQAGIATFAAVSAKAVIGTFSAVLLGATTSFPALLRALERLHVPQPLTLIAAFSYRYLFVIAGELARMRAGMAARGYRPRHLLDVGATGRMASAMFLRTYARAERVYLAMAARGWSGHMPEAVPLSFARADTAFVALVVAPLVLLRIATGAL